MPQDQVSNLREQLDEINKVYSRKDANDVSNGTFRDQEDQSEILEETCDKLIKYNKYWSELRRSSVSISIDKYDATIKTKEIF